MVPNKRGPGVRCCIEVLLSPPPGPVVTVQRTAARMSHRPVVTNVAERAEARGFVDSTTPNSMNPHARQTLGSSSVRVLGVRVRGLLVVEFGADAA